MTGWKARYYFGPENNPTATVADIFFNDNKYKVCASGPDLARPKREVGEDEWQYLDRIASPVVIIKHRMFMPTYEDVFEELNNYIMKVAL